jgi:membrane-bound lytic murein transglycosylase D
MKFPWTTLVVVMLMLSAIQVNAYSPSETIALASTLSNPAGNDLGYRLEQLDVPFSVRNTAHVRTYVRRYLVEGYRDSEDILGRATLYFPIFEHYLELYGLPESLKYLPIVESALKPAVHSPVGAAGLWQFVPATARIYGLRVNDQVDERLDPHKSTEAAIRMLSALYEQFGDWGLVLAAYNCGPGRVKRIMRTYGATDFWEAQPYLPQESQKYVPRFIAATYMVSYHHVHGISPDYLAADLQQTQTYRVFRSLHLSTVARTLGLSYRTLQKLNPSYLQGLVPENQHGQMITVPERVAAQFEAAFLAEVRAAGPTNRQRTTYVTVPGDSLDTLAQLFQCSKEDLIRWNQLPDDRLTVNQPLTIYLPQAVVRP